MKKAPKRLYRVLLDWPDEGDFCSLVWAVDGDAAILATAKEMAACTVSELTRSERKRFIDELVVMAGPYAAEVVAASLPNTLHMLLSGPRNKMTKARQAAYDEIIRLLTVQGALA